VQTRQASCPSLGGQAACLLYFRDSAATPRRFGEMEGSTMNSQRNAPVYDAKRVADLLGMQYTEEQIKSFGPPPAPVEGYVTFFDPGLSILDIRSKVADKGHIFCVQTWYETQEFANREDRPRY